MRAQQELPLLLTQAGALRVIKGYAAPEVGQAFSRARELCRHAGGHAASSSIFCWDSARAIIRIGENCQTARELMEQALTLAQRLHDPVLPHPGARKSRESTCITWASWPQPASTWSRR